MKAATNAKLFNHIRSLDTPLPSDYKQRISTAEFVNKGYSLAENENLFLKNFINSIIRYDPDIIVGHDLYNTIFDTLISRLTRLNIPNFSRLGRLQKKTLGMPKTHFSMYKARFITSGRLLCDTYMSSKELVRESDYGLSNLSEKHLNLKRKEIEDCSTCFDNSYQLIAMQEHTAYDAYLAFQLMQKFQILPLTK